MSYNDLRKGRVSELGRAYHLATVTAGRRPVFQSLAAGRVVVHWLRRMAREQRAETLCFVVMPDHVHWLMVLQEGTLSDVVSRVKSGVARDLAEGHIWQPNFYDHALRSEEDLRAVARYIVANPIRAGLVSQIGDYPLWDAVWL